MTSQLPGARAAIADNQGLPTPEFYRFLLGLQRLSAGSATSADIAALQTQIAAIQAEIDGLPKSSFPTLQVTAPLTSSGLLQNGFAKLGVNTINSVVVNGNALQLSGDVSAPGNTYFYGSSVTGAKGWQALSGVLHASANVAVTFAADGTATFDLQPLTDSGAGTFKLITRDSFGRLAGTKAGTTSDVPEGTNLYYTDVRADARIALQKGQPNGLATLGADSKLDPGQLPALAITETFVVSTQAAMLALAAQQGDVCVRTDLHDSFILTTNDPTVLANWQQLETPVDGVASFNGRTGSVTPASGDYNTTQVTEGSNLYFTDERAQDAVGNAVDGTGDVPLSYNDATGAISAALSSGVQASLDLADSSVQPGDDVSDLNNDAGYVDASGAQTAVVAASITNGDTTHAPSGDAVFDALANKFDKAGGTISGNVTVIGSFNSSFANFPIQAAGNSISLAPNGAADTSCTVFVSKGANAIQPASDNVFNCGRASNRWKEVFAGTGVINTSDAREKTEPRDLTDAELACAADLSRLPCVYQWLHAIEAKGEDGARLHCGPTVQSVIAVMESHGLDPFRYAFICYDEWPETPEQRDPETGDITQPRHPAGDRYGFRTDELLMFIARGLAARLDALESI